jgi:hypothetical protein
MRKPSFEKHEATINNVNVHREKHGKEGKLGIDISFHLQTGNGALDMLEKGLKESLFRKASKGEQLDLVEGSDGLVALKFPTLQPLKLEGEFLGYEVYIDGLLEGTEQISLIDVKLKDFVIAPIEGGSVGLSFKAQLPATGEELGQIVDAWMNKGIRLTLVPTEQQEEQKAA